MKRSTLSWLTASLLLLLGADNAVAHVGYTNRDFGSLVPNATPVTIINQTVTGNFGWADGTDDNFGDSHDLRAYRFTLAAPALVTITFSGSTNATSGTVRDGTLKPGFSIYQGLANLPPRPPGHSADHDGSPISQAYLATLPGPAKKGAFRSLATWRMGGDFQTGPTFDFEDPATGLSTFVFKGYAVDGDASLYGTVPGIYGDGNADGTVTGTFYLTAGDYSIFVGGANYAGQNGPDTEIVYGLTGTVSAVAFTHEVVAAPSEEGVPYGHIVTLGSGQSGGFSGLVGAWSWEDNTLFGNPGQGTAPVGWTHTSNWARVHLQNDTLLTVTMARDANVPEPTLEDPDKKADTTSLFPSLTLWQGSQTTGSQGHTYNNRGAVAWAPGLRYLDHVDNATAESITRTWFLPKGEYTLALGSNAPATNPNQQGYSVTFTTQDQLKTDPVPFEAGIGYAHTVNVRAGSNGSFSNHTGAWSWEDNALFAPGQQPVGWTHTSQWMALNVDEDEVLFTLQIERDANVPWPSQADPNRLADTSSMFPSFTVWRHWDNDPVPAGFKAKPEVIESWAAFGGVPDDLGDWHTYFNRGNVEWAEKLRYLDHVDNATATTITRTYRLKRGQYSFAIGSNAPATNSLRQGFKLTYSTTLAPKIVIGDPSPGGIVYAWLITAGLGDSGSVSNHVGSWSWEDSRLFTPGQPPVGWTHHSNWLALNVTEPLAFSVTMNRNANVPWPSEALPDRKAAIDEMFPSLTVWRGLHNNGGDSHTYNNRGNVSWAPGLQYLDHIDNTSATSITRTWTLMPGQYTFALGSNSPENTVNPQRQGYSFAWSTSAPAFESPFITRQPRGATVLVGRPVSLSVQATGEDLAYQWFKDGRPIPGANNPLYQPSTTEGGSALYTAEVRNSAGWLHSDPALVTVISTPVLDADTMLPPLEVGQTEPALPPGTIGQSYAYTLGGIAPGTRMTVSGLPRGLRFNPRNNTISGIPVLAGVFDVTLIGSNAAGRSSPLLAKLTIAAMPTGTVATFTGPLGRATLLNNKLGGHVQLSVTNLGGFSAVVKLGTQTHRKQGQVSFGGGSTPVVGQFTLPRPGQATVTLSFTLFDGIARGSVSDGATTLPFEARARASATEASTFAYGYTFAMQPGGDQLGSPSVPQGYCLGGFVCQANGSTRGSMLLPDDTAITFSTNLEKGGHLTLFNLLYRNTGSLVAVLHLQGEAANGDMRLSEASLFKHVERGGKASPYLWQRTGFAPVEMEVIGGRYAASSGMLATLGLAANSAGNASLEFAFGGVADPATTLNVDALEVLDQNGAAARIVSANPGQVSLNVRGLGIGNSSGGGSTAKATFSEFTVTKKSDRNSVGRFILTQPDSGSGGSVTLNGVMTGLIVFDGLTPRLVGFFQLPVSSAPNSAKTTGKWDLKNGVK